ncbi:MAG: peptidase M22 [Sulfobacillus acidophilus]|uniref:N(6)-L-threonylcarbamoyladenine synthase n=1 Tax=Sulfobacillus acidophilus TaxID=53633 RepID=A0A2T2WPN2_9FIRM|nr:MAG: peptidase M22 [Sulfobacillus acidophilus]
MRDPWVLGIDTSAYTTSVAAVFQSGRYFEARRLLPVPVGARGLRASDAVFYHNQHLPRLVEEVVTQTDRADLVAISVSTKPRPIEKSYLPCFVAGKAVGRSLAALASVPVFSTTHQEGHIRAGIAGSGLTVQREFLVWHVSGGTTELLAVTPASWGFAITLKGGSDDLYAGQFVDRIGVLLGLPFPAGPDMDQLAESSLNAVDLPWSRPRFKNNLWWTSFAGPESAARRAFAQGADRAALARGVMEVIARSLAAVVLKFNKPTDLLVVGGVAANAHLRRRLGLWLSAAGWTVWFADPRWSRDNAIGVAYLGLDAWQRRRGQGMGER